MSTNITFDAKNNKYTYKVELVEEVATATGLTKADVTRVFEAINNKQTLNEEKELINFC